MAVSILLCVAQIPLVRFVVQLVQIYNKTLVDSRLRPRRAAQSRRVMLHGLAVVKQKLVEVFTCQLLCLSYSIAIRNAHEIHVIGTVCEGNDVIQKTEVT